MLFTQKLVYQLLPSPRSSYVYRSGPADNQHRPVENGMMCRIDLICLRYKKIRNMPPYMIFVADRIATKDLLKPTKY